MVDAHDSDRPATGEPVDHSHDVYTLANIITVLRLMLVPFAFAVLVNGENDVLSFLLFAVAASTDWLDGQIARRTGTVTEIGKAIDPLVDRLLIAAGVLGLYIDERIPLWIVLFLLSRDLYLLGGAAYLAKNRAGRLPVVYIGKVTTMLLLGGFSGMILGWPRMSGLGVLDGDVLPGLSAEPVAVWIWLVYAGVAFSAATAVVYTAQARQALRLARRATQS